MNYFDTDAKVSTMDGPDIRHVFNIRFLAGHGIQYSAYRISKVVHLVYGQTPGIRPDIWPGNQCPAEIKILYSKFFGYPARYRANRISDQPDI